MEGASYTRTRDAVNPYIRQDLRDAKAVSVHTWCKAVFGFPEDRLNSWMRSIREKDWFNDPIISQALSDFCGATFEDERYHAFITFADHVVKLARGALPGLDDKYPIDDLVFADHHLKEVAVIEDHGPCGAKRKPDIVGVRRKHAEILAKGGDIRWIDILLLFELKFGAGHKLAEKLDAERKRRAESPLPSTDNVPTASVELAAEDDTSPEEDDLLGGIEKVFYKPRNTTDPAAGNNVAIQTASYALELLSCTYGTRMFCLASILMDDRMSLWYYDACGVVYTRERLSLVSQFEMFAAIIVGFAQCTPEQFGVIPASVLRPTVPYSRRFPPENLGQSRLQITHPTTKETMAVVLEESIFTQYILVGRRTFLYSLDPDPEVSENKLVIKFSYQVSTRKAEHKFVDMAKKVKVRHLPDVHMWADLWKMSEGARGVFFTKTKGSRPYEDRTLRAIVYSEYASVKQLFASKPESVPIMVYQMMTCLDDLWTKLRMLHRDISVHNIMYQMHGEHYHFVLIDFDMAIVIPEGQTSYPASSRHRTGTLPFMAAELLRDAYAGTDEDDTNEDDKNRKPIKHLLRHDLESLFWVSVWCLITLPLKGLSKTEVERKIQCIYTLERGSLRSISFTKSSVFRLGLHEACFVLPPNSRCVKRWLDRFCTMLEKGLRISDEWKNLKRKRDRREQGLEEDDTDHDSDEDADSDSGDEDHGIDKESETVWETGGEKLTPTRLKAKLLKVFPLDEYYIQQPMPEGGSRVRAAAKTTKTDVPQTTTRNNGRKKKAPITRPKLPDTRAPARKKAKTTPSTLVPIPENDIRSRLRPRKPSAY